jgi:hypothetical protein
MELGEKSWGPAATLCANQEKKNGDRPGARTRTANWSSDSTARNRIGAVREETVQETKNENQAHIDRIWWTQRGKTATSA